MTDGKTRCKNQEKETNGAIAPETSAQCYKNILKEFKSSVFSPKATPTGPLIDKLNYFRTQFSNSPTKMSKVEEEDSTYMDSAVYDTNIIFR